MARLEESWNERPDTLMTIHGSAELYECSTTIHRYGIMEGVYGCTLVVDVGSQLLLMAIASGFPMLQLIYGCVLRSLL